MFIVCTESFYMSDSKEEVFTRGKIYDCTIKGSSYCLIDNNGDFHYMEDKDMLECFCLSKWYEIEFTEHKGDYKIRQEIK